jgi:hypothetical protein
VKDSWDIAAHIGTVVGLCVAGVWAYFNFVKSRTYYPRMEMTVVAELRSSGTSRYVLPRVTLKNIGHSKIALVQRGSGYRIWLGTEDVDGSHQVGWSQLGPVYSMFEEHGWIEPGECISDETRLIALPGNCVAAKIQARLVARVRRFPCTKNSEWNASAIAGPMIVKEGSHEIRR